MKEAGVIGSICIVTIAVIVFLISIFGNGVSKAEIIAGKKATSITFDN